MNFKASAIVSAMTMISRVFGLARDIVIAKLFGAGAELDAFLVAFRIPSFLRRVFAEGSFSQAVIPVLAKSKINNSEQIIINHITGRLFVVLFFVTLIVVVFSPLFIFIFAPTYYFDDINKFNMTSELLRITFPYLLFISLSALFSSILNVNDKFVIPAITPVLLNISLIVCAIYLSPNLDKPIYALAIGVLIGGLLQLALHLPFLMMINKLPKPTNKKHKVFKKIKDRMLPVLFSSSIVQINLLVDTIVATTLITGSVSWLYYASKILELPLALIGGALGTVSIVSFSKLFVNRSLDNLRQSISAGFNVGIIFGIPAAIGLIVLSKPIIVTLFKYDNFDKIDAINSANALSIYAFGVVFFVIVRIINTVFLAIGDLKSSVKIAVIAMFSNIILNIVLSYYLGFIGIAMATTISSVISACGLLILLSKKNIFSLKYNNVVIVFKTVVAALLMFATLTYFDFNYDGGNLYSRLTHLLIEVVSASSVYFLALFLLRVNFRNI